MEKSFSVFLFIFVPKYMVLLTWQWQCENVVAYLHWFGETVWRLYTRLYDCLLLDMTSGLDDYNPHLESSEEPCSFL